METQTLKNKVFGFGSKIKDVRNKIKNEVDRSIKVVKDVNVKNKIKTGIGNNVRKVKDSVVKKKGSQTTG